MLLSGVFIVVTIGGGNVYAWWPGEPLEPFLAKDCQHELKRSKASDIMRLSTIRISMCVCKFILSARVLGDILAKGG